MKRKIIIGAVLITAFALAVPAQSLARWDVSIHIPIPGLYYYAPQLAPGVYGYAPPAAGPLFYGGYWYRPGEGRWFIAAQVAGPWYVIAAEQVPLAVMQMPAYHEGGRGPDGRYIAPRLLYDDDGHGRRHGHRHDD